GEAYQTPDRRRGDGSPCRGCLAGRQFGVSSSYLSPAPVRLSTPITDKLTPLFACTHPNCRRDALVSDHRLGSSLSRKESGSSPPLFFERSGDYPALQNYP